MRLALLCVAGGLGFVLPTAVSATEGVITFGDKGHKDGQFEMASGVAVAPDGTVYVSDRDNHRVQAFTPRGDFLRKFGQLDPGPGSLNSPLGLDVSPDGKNVLVADAKFGGFPSGDGIKVFSAAGVPKGSFGAAEIPSGPWDVATAPDGDIWVAEANGGGYIHHFTSAGTYLGGWKATYSATGAGPLAIEVASSGNILAAFGGGGSNGLIEYDESGSPVMSFGDSGKVPLPYPQGVAVGSDGKIYVVLANGELRVLSPAGDPIESYSLNKFAGGARINPQAVAVAPSGRVYVAEALTEDGDDACCFNYQVQGFDLDNLGGSAQRPPGPDGVSVNDGAQYTNDPHVTITLRWPDFAQDAVVSNDGGFQPAKQFELAAKVPWTLDSSGAERLPKTVYVRFPGGPNGARDYTDDIILDETSPTVDSVSAAGAASAQSARAVLLRKRHKVKLRIDASDSNSGVGKMQIAENKRHAGKAVKYTKRVKVKTSAKKLFVRVIDRAGNKSRWKKVMLR